MSRFIIWPFSKKWSSRVSNDEALGLTAIRASNVYKICIEEPGNRQLTNCARVALYTHELDCQDDYNIYFGIDVPFQEAVSQFRALANEVGDDPIEAYCIQ